MMFWLIGLDQCYLGNESKHFYPRNFVISTPSWQSPDNRHVLLVNSAQRNCRSPALGAHYDLQNQNYMYRASRPYFDCDVDVITFHVTITSCVFGVEISRRGMHVESRARNEVTFSVHAVKTVRSTECLGVSLHCIFRDFRCGEVGRRN